MPGGQPRIFTYQQALTLRQEYEADELLSISILARRCYVAYGTMRKTLRWVGTPLRPKGNPPANPRKRSPQEDEAETIDFLYWGLGFSQADVGERLGLTQSGVLSRMRRHGIPTRNASDALKMRHKKKPYSEQERQQRSEVAKKNRVWEHTPNWKRHLEKLEEAA